MTNSLPSEFCFPSIFEIYRVTHKNLSTFPLLIALQLIIVHLLGALVSFLLLYDQVLIVDGFSKSIHYFLPEMRANFFAVREIISN